MTQEKNLQLLYAKIADVNMKPCMENTVFGVGILNYADVLCVENEMKSQRIHRIERIIV